MESGKRNRQIANAYYNLGLIKAGQRDLCGAVAALKKSLRFDKFQTDARNLLGLIYNEIGEVGAALTQWVISLNLQETDNLAEEYLRKVHAARGYLEVADQAAKKYNQALNYAQNENEDLAVLLLMRMLDEFPQYVKAQELLALLYIHHEDYTKAGRCLYQALKVDRYNPLAQRYMTVAKQNTGRAEIEKRKLKNAFSHRQMQDDDIIIPPSYKENTGWQSILNILVGLVLGAMVIFFLVMPASREALNAAHNQELEKHLELVNQKSIEIDSLNQKLEDAQAAQASAEGTLATLVSDNGGVISQYQNLARMLQAYRDEDLRTVAEVYVGTDMDVLNDGVLNDIVTAIRADMSEQGYGILAQMGDEAMNQENGAAQAIDYYQKSLLIKGDNPEVIYKVGMAYQATGDTDQANEYFGNVIMNYPDSDYAAQAKTQRGY
ncbi:MAG: tetratricopeptide repeat protein [Lachnospiraceae bacterium]|nr:tetratricopeptide repeat protein [Lachnospiraceae bacterium]